MNQLLCHLWGDYILQNEYMALNKESKTLPCLLHCLIYTFCFSFLTHSFFCLFLIFSSHFLIDRFSLVKRVYSYKDSPDHVKWTLSIIADNTIHLTCNYIILSLI